MRRQIKGVAPVMVHATYQTEGGPVGKRHRMREAGLWHDSPGYFEAPEGYLQVMLDALDPPPPKATDDALLDVHMHNLQKQLAQVGAGLMLATALQRVLVLPQLTCYCDRSWCVSNQDC